MYAFLTLLVAILFSFWVWTLKHELHELNRQVLATGPDGSHESVQVEPVRDREPPPSRVVVSNQAPGFKGRNTDGVPVWTIDA